MADMSGIEAQLEKQSNKLEALAESISQLAQILARKEAHDHHIEETIKEIKADNVETKKRVLALEKVSVGDEAMRKVFWTVLTLGVTIVSSSIIWIVVSK